MMDFILTQLIKFANTSVIGTKISCILNYMSCKVTIKGQLHKHTTKQTFCNDMVYSSVYTSIKQIDFQCVHLFFPQTIII